MFNSPASCTREEKLGILKSTGSQGLGPHEWQPGTLALVAALSPKGGYSGGQVLVLLFFVVIVDQTQ